MLTVNWRQIRNHNRVWNCRASTTCTEQEPLQNSSRSSATIGCVTRSSSAANSVTKSGSANSSETDSQSATCSPTSSGSVTSSSSAMVPAPRLVTAPQLALGPVVAPQLVRRLPLVPPPQARLRFDARLLWSARRPTEDLFREAKSASAELGHQSSSGSPVAQGGAGPVKTTAQVVTPSSPATSANSVLSNFLYGMPMSSKPHPDGPLDIKPSSLLNLGKDRLAKWTDKGACGKEAASIGNTPGGELGLESEPDAANVAKLFFFLLLFFF